MASRSPGDSEQISSTIAGNIDSIVLNDDARFHGPLIAGGVQGGMHYHEHVTPRQHEDLQDVLASMKSMLRAKYRKMEIPKLPWLREWYLPFQDYYIDLSLCTKNEGQLNLEDLFKPTEKTTWSSSRILINGPAGYGKTTLVRKLCYDYGIGEFRYIQEFELVLLISLAEFEDSLDNTIFKALNIEKYSSQAILDAVNKYQSKMLLILDGLDDLDETKRELIMPLLASKQLPQATVVVTSRPGSVYHTRDYKVQDGLCELYRYFDRLLEITGMQEKDVRQFLKLYLKGESQEMVLSVKLFLWSLFGIQFDELNSRHFKKQHKELRRKSDSIILTRSRDKKIFECPLVMLLVVVVALETDMTSLTTRTDLYKAFFNLILHRALIKAGKSEKQTDLFSFDNHNPPAYVEMFNDFGHFALKALHEKKISFTEAELLSSCTNGDTLMKLGLFTKTDTRNNLKKTTLFQPIHGSLMEFSAAYHLWYILISNSTPLKFLTNYDKMLQFFPDISGVVQSLVFPFLIGLCKDQLSLLFSTLAKVQKEYYWLKCYAHCRILVDESQLQRDVLGNILLPFVPSAWKASYFEEDNLQAVTDLLTKTVVQAVLSGQVQSFIQDSEFTIDLKDSVMPGTLQLCDPNSKEVLRAFQGVKCNQLRFVLRSTKNMAMVVELLKTATFKQLSFCLSGKYLDRHLVWLVVVFNDGFLEDSHIHFLQCTCSEYNIVNEIKQLTYLISREKVESLAITLEGLVPATEWEEFVISVNQSQKLLQLSIICHCKESYEFQLHEPCQKEWRKLEFKGGIIVKDAHIAKLQQLMLNENTQIENVENIGRSTSIQSLKLSTKTTSACPTLSFIDHLSNSWSISQSLQELFIDFTCIMLVVDVVLDFKGLAHLTNLQVLGLECSGIDAEESCSNQEDVQHILRILNDNSPQFMRLELWMIRDTSFLSSLLQFLNLLNCSEQNEKAPTQIPEHGDVKLHTLFLLFEDEVYGCPVLANKSLKKLLVEGNLEQLWLGIYADNFVESFQREKSANNIHLIHQHFPPSDGCVYELWGGEYYYHDLSSSSSRWWKNDMKVIKLSMYV